MSTSIAVAGVTLDIEEAGTGRPLLFLHPGEGLQANRPWIDALAKNHRVIAPITRASAIPACPTGLEPSTISLIYTSTSPNNWA